MAKTPILSDRPVALLLKHAERTPIPPDGPGNNLPLTDRGRWDATALGLDLSGVVRSLSASPVRRCVETADAIRAGAGAPLPIRHDRMLGDPGAFTADPELAWKTWCEWGRARMYRELIEGKSTPPGMADPCKASRRLAKHVVDQTEYLGGIHVFVTHDLLIATLAARTLRTSFDDTPWPAFLTGLVLWPDHGRIRLFYAGKEGVID